MKTLSHPLPLFARFRYWLSRLICPPTLGIIFAAEARILNDDCIVKLNKAVPLNNVDSRERPASFDPRGYYKKPVPGKYSDICPNCRSEYNGFVCSSCFYKSANHLARSATFEVARDATGRDWLTAPSSQKLHSFPKPELAGWKSVRKHYEHGLIAAPIPVQMNRYQPSTMPAKAPSSPNFEVAMQQACGSSLAHSNAYNGSPQPPGFIEAYKQAVRDAI